MKPGDTYFVRIDQRLDGEGQTKFEKQSIYDSQYQATLDRGLQCWGGDHRLEKKMEQIDRLLTSPHVPESGKVFEAGCGEGVLCREFNSRGYQVTGAEISAVAVNWAKSKSREQGLDINFIHADLSRAETGITDSFDLIIDGNCLHCITGKGRVNFLNNLAGMLAPGGTLFISSLCSSDDQNHTLYNGEVPYRFIPTPEHLLQELKDSGFSILDWKVARRREFSHMEAFARIS